MRVEVTAENVCEDCCGIQWRSRAPVRQSEEALPGAGRSRCRGREMDRKTSNCMDKRQLVEGEARALCTGKPVHQVYASHMQ